MLVTQLVAMKSTASWVEAHGMKTPFVVAVIPQPQAFSLLGTNLGHGNTTFVDDNGGLGFDYGVEYCYIVRAFFDEGLRSCATEIVCVEIQKDFPVLLKDSVAVTDATLGEIQVEWSQPDNVDSIFQGPYTYHLLRANGIVGAPVWTTIATGLAFDDTTLPRCGNEYF
jgi:hypothetical protein